MLHIKDEREKKKERKTGGKDHCVDMVCSVLFPEGTYKDNSVRHVQDLSNKLLLVCTFFVLFSLLTRRLDLGHVLQQLLALVDDVVGQVVHGERLVCVVLQPLLRQRQILGVEVTHLLGELLIP